MDVATMVSVLESLEAAAPGWPATAVAEMQRLPDEPFVVLVATVLSSRTKDETTVPAARRLLARAPDPAALSALRPAEVAELIFPVGFYKTKARHLPRLGALLAAEFGGAVPARREDLMRLPGVGRKTANLVLSRAFRQAAICVDTHVHRIMNRFGFVRTHSPAETEAALMQTLPVGWWRRVNELLVHFGQALCRPVGPRCGQCPVTDRCPRIGVVAKPRHP